MIDGIIVSDARDGVSVNDTEGVVVMVMEQVFLSSMTKKTIHIFIDVKICKLHVYRIFPHL